MSINDPLGGQIHRLRKRVRLLFIERYSLFGGSLGAVASAILAALSYKYTDFANYTLWALLIAAGVISGCVYGLLRKLDDLSVAKSADRRTGLKERLSSAISLRDSVENDMEKALVDDAASHVAPLRSGEVFRHRFGKPHVIFALALLALLAIAIVPQLSRFQSQTRRQEITVMKREGKKMVKVAKDIKKLTDPKQEELKKMAVALEKLGKKMQMGRMSRKQAMLKAKRLEKQIKKEQDRLAKENSGRKTMEQARAEMREAGEQLARSMAEKLAQKENIPISEAMEKIPSDKRLAELARKSGPLTKSEREELEKALSKYANPNSQVRIPPELAEALARLAESEDYQKAMEIMQKLAIKMDSGKMSKMDKEALRKQMEALAKALEKTDLDQLAKMMRENAEKLAKMSPQELQKMIDEMKRMQRLCQAMNKAGGT
ncbi:MAG: hypothetical protein Q7N50_11805 [Armatimonadota bacterium]|nr:hypothetical protein [Armatimonadota bacterium]